MLPLNRLKTHQCKCPDYWRYKDIVSALRLMSSNYLGSPIATVDQPGLREWKTRLNILEAIKYGQELFNSIAADTFSDNSPGDSVKLSRKQYYNKLSKLIKVDLIKIQKWKVFTDTFRKGDLRSTTRIWWRSRQSSQNWNTIVEK